MPSFASYHSDVTKENEKDMRTFSISSTCTACDADLEAISTTAMPKQALDWEHDASNPHNWKAPRKYTVTILVSCLTFNTLMSSTMVAPALPQIGKDLKISSDSRTQLVLSIYVLAYAVGYFFWAPMSEVYGRKRILQLGNLWFCIWNTVCGFAHNEATITVGRLLSGAGAAASLALGSGIASEIWQPAERGKSLALLSTITLLGPSVGPILGGVIAAQSPTSWRWAFWSTTIFNAVLQAFSVLFLHETHAQTIIRRHHKQMEEKGSPGTSDYAKSMGRVLLTSLKRPFFLLLTQPASQGLIVFSGVAFGALYILISVLTEAFVQVYNQSLLIASINYISFGIGPTLGSQLCGPMMDAMYRCQQRKFNELQESAEHANTKAHSTEKVPAEFRLYPLIPNLIIMTAGLCLLGWSLQYRLHWAVPNVGIIVFGIGNQATTQCINAYMIDTFGDIKSASTGGPSTLANAIPKVGLNWTASAMASMWSIKALGGFAFPLFAVDVIKVLHWGWTSTLLAFLNLAVGLPVTVMLLMYGKKLRATGRARIEKKIAAGEL